MRKMRRLICLGLLLMLLCGSALAASYDAKALTRMPVYARADSDSQALGTLKQKTSFTVTAISGDWARISYKGRSGYAKLEDIIFDDGIKATVRKDADLRFVTEESYAKGVYYKATIEKGTKVYVVGLNGDEALVTNGSGSALGYMSLSKLSKG